METDTRPFPPGEYPIVVVGSGVTLEADVFVGHGVMFINDRHPSVAAALDRSWKLEPTLVRAGASIGSGALTLGALKKGEPADLLK